MNKIELARSLVVGFVIDQVRGRARGLAIVGAFVFMASLVFIVVLDGAPRALAIVAALLAAAAVVVVWLLKSATVRLLGRFAKPLAATSHGAAVDRALQELDLPTGPLGTARFAWRLRRGTGAELERVTTVVASLRDELDEP